MFDFFEEVKYEPIAFGRLGIHTYAMIKSTIMGFLYTPRTSYPSLGTYLTAMLTRNETLYEEYAVASAAGGGGGGGDPAPFPEISSAASKENTYGIRCSDESIRSDDLAAIVPLLDKWQSESRLGGDITPVTQTVLCSQWPFKAKERYTGGFKNIKVKNPILFVANTFDPITSVKAARNASAAFNGSRLLVHEGHGVSSRHCPNMDATILISELQHAILSQPSPCTAKTIRRYLEDGTMPEDGFVCPSAYPPFKTISDEKLYKLLADDD